MKYKNKNLLFIKSTLAKHGLSRTNFRTDLLDLFYSFDNISLDWFIDKNLVSQVDYKGLATPDGKIKDENSGKINTIVHFYENGTFKIFKNSD